jgi:lysozyme family protein
MPRYPKPPQAVPAFDGFAGRDRNDRFSICLRALLAAEGGFNDIPQDRGGATNFGISLRFLRAEAAINPQVRGLFPAGADATANGRPIDIEDIRSLTVEQAAKIYLWCFWVPAKCDALPRHIDHAVFDQAVNAGIRTAGRMLQRAINIAGKGVLPTLIEDGAIGPRTVEASQRIMMTTLRDTLRRVAADRYRGLVVARPSQSVFLNGWLARAAKLGSV